MDEQQVVIKKKFTRAELEAMTVDELIALVGQSGVGAKFHGTAVVRSKLDGKIKYDPEAVPGAFNESPADLTKADLVDTVNTRDGNPAP